MNQATYLHFVNAPHIDEVVHHIFPTEDVQVERVLSGISTYVYRLTSRNQTYYLRILPENDESFASETAALTLLQHNHIRAPKVVFFEDYNITLERSMMIETEIKGQALSKSSLSKEAFEKIAQDAGRDLARINNMIVEGFGLVKKPDQDDPLYLKGSWPTYQAFILSQREADLAYLKEHVLKVQESTQLERVLTRYDSLLDREQGYLAHGDLDTTHIFQNAGHYTGIIDFGEIRGTDRWYDLAHFRIRDGALPSYRLFPALERGYAEITPLPATYEQQLRFTSVLINLRALSRAFQTRPPDEYIWRQLEVLHEDLVALA